MVNMCLSVLSHHLFDGDLWLSRGSINNSRKRKRGNLIPITREEQQRWLTFLHRALVDIIAWGFVAFHDDLAEVDISSCTVTISRITREITIVNTRDDDDDRPITTINAFGYCPDFNGDTTSIMTTLLPWIAFVNNLRMYTSTLELKKIEPDLVLQRTPETDTTPNRSQHESDNGNPLTVNAEYANGDRVLTEGVGFRADGVYHHAFNASVRQGARHANTLAGSGPTFAGGRNTTIPEKRTLAHFGTANGRGDIVGLMRGTQQLVCAALGVPRTMIINDSVARADTTATHDRLRAALKKYRRHLEHVFTVAYNIIHPEANAYATGHMPDVFYGPPETLAQMWLLGVITFERYTSILAKTFGLAPPVGNVDLFTPEQRAEIAAECMRNIITQHHGRT